MRVSYLRADVTGLGGSIGMTSALGLGRTLELDLDELRAEHGRVTLVSLVEEMELECLRIPDLVERACERGVEVIRFPIADHSAPRSLEGLIELVERLLAVTRDGRTVVIHCWSGLGRTGMVAAICLVACGFTPAKACATVRQHRPRTIAQGAQEECVAAFARAFQGRSIAQHAGSGADVGSDDP